MIEAELWATPEPLWPQAVEDYLAAGSDVNTRHPKSGWTLLHVAAEYRLPETIKLLIQHHADINIQDYQGWTPLHVAVDADIDQASQCGEEITLATTRALIEAGADLTPEDKQVRTPRDIARAYGQGALDLYDSIVASYNR